MRNRIPFCKELYGIWGSEELNTKYVNRKLGDSSMHVRTHESEKKSIFLEGFFFE